MRGAHDHSEALLQLPHLADPSERRATWRQSMASLAHLVENARRPVPLEGMRPEALRAAVRTALEDKLLDDLDWLSGTGSAAALYELAAALPSCPEKKELGRRVLTRLHQSEAPAFVTLATRLALGSRRALTGPSIRARVALTLELPHGLIPRVNGLALALISRRDLERDWLGTPSTGSLPARRMAARLLERAAHEAAARAAEGDDSGLRVFRLPSVRAAWNRLLEDRESLVWRHVAIARGLLASVEPPLAAEIEHGLAPELSPTEWRRAAASLAASITHTPQESLRRCQEVLATNLPSLDAGIPAAMVSGLSPAASTHPVQVEEALRLLVETGGLAIGEALFTLLREFTDPRFGESARSAVQASIQRALAHPNLQDDGERALYLFLMQALETPAYAGGSSLRSRLEEALLLFVAEGSDAAFRGAKVALNEVRAKVKRLESSVETSSDGRTNAYDMLRDIDTALFESDLLTNLLTLGAGAQSPAEQLRPVGDLFERLTNWMILRESTVLTPDAARENFRFRLRKLQALLHLVDADGRQIEDRASLLRDRRVRVARALVDRARREGKNSLRRALCASIARVYDAMIREDFAEISDVIISAAKHLPRPEDLGILADAAMLPEIEQALRAYARLEEATQNAPPSGSGIRLCLDALAEVGKRLPVAVSPRVEALRGCLLDYGLALEGVAGARGLLDLQGREGEAHLIRLRDSTQSMARLVSGARRRLGEFEPDESPASSAALHLLGFGIEKAISGDRAALKKTIPNVAETLARELPHALSECALLTIERLSQMEIEPAGAPTDSFLPTSRKEAPLPPWMPPGRTLGGFYVMRALGAGAVGSVFLSRRSDAVNPEDAERFALKVPEYDGAAAHSLSEEEFMRLFRDEAGALLALPSHPNLARFVTFDAGARPKPILVMELVNGPTLERRLESETVSASQGFEMLDGMAAGLEVMHLAGVGHLDIKPSNVILRQASGGQEAAVTPVLVDFGLAGRHLRPGCATANYGAPEIWGGAGPQNQANPLPADVYAFGCVIFEVLSNLTLFDGPTPMAMISSHLSHDGLPPGVKALHDDPNTRTIAQLLRGMLRRDPADRISISAARETLRSLRDRYQDAAWPIRPAL